MPRNYIKDVSKELWAQHKQHVKYVAIATAIGALVAIPIPGVGPNGGAIVGAIAGVALLVKKHAVELGHAPRIKTSAEQILELNELLASGKITEEQHKILADSILRSS